MACPGDHAHETDPALRVLHALRCTGFASLERVADATGRDESDVESELIDLSSAGSSRTEWARFGG
jgi:hypothetical protein